jgi:hypothetical protein
MWPVTLMRGSAEAVLRYRGPHRDRFLNRHTSHFSECQINQRGVPPVNQFHCQGDQ